MGVKRICCIGAGYVGGTSCSVIALKCPEVLVTVVDVNAEKIMQWNSENLPIPEPGLGEIVKECRNKNLFFSTDIVTSIKEADLIFICVNTPAKTCGFDCGRAMDLQNVETAARLIADVGVGEKIIVEKTAVPVRSAEIIMAIFKSNHHSHYQILSNPEFLTDGCALHELLFPDRIIIGGENTTECKAAMDKLSSIYEHWVPKERILMTNTWSSQLAKLATSAFLAQRLSSINSMSILCEAAGGCISQVTAAIGYDSRIGSKCLDVSLGFGGRNYKRDILYLVYICEALGFPILAQYWHTILEINEMQTLRFTQKIVDGLYKTLTDKNIAILGFANKNCPWRLIDNPAVFICSKLLEEGAKLQVYDPIIEKAPIMNIMKLANERDIQKSFSVVDDPYQAITNSHAIVICTDCEEFKNLDFERIFFNMIKPAFIFDGQNILNHEDLITIGFVVETVGKDLSKVTGLSVLK